MTSFFFALQFYISIIVFMLEHNYTILFSEEVSTTLSFFSNSEHDTVFGHSTPNVSTGPV